MKMADIVKVGEWGNGWRELHGIGALHNYSLASSFPGTQVPPDS